MTAREEEEEEAITGIESNGAHLYFCRFPSFLFPHSLPGFSLFFRLLSVLFFFFFFLFPTTVPSFPIVCAFIRATYRPPVQFLAIHFSIEEEKKKHNMMTECGYGLLPPLF